MCLSLLAPLQGGGSETLGTLRGGRMTYGDLSVWRCHFCVWVGPVSGSEDLKRVGSAGGR